MSFIASGIDHNKDLGTDPEEQERLAWKRLWYFSY